MTAYIIRRLLIGIVVLFCVTILVFTVMHMMPGNPLLLYISENDTASFTEQQLREMEHKYGLDKSIPEQYIDWVTGVFQGNLGISIFYNQTVNRLIIERLPITFHLGVLSIIFGSVVGIFFGAVCAMQRGKFIDSFLTVIANLGVTVPSFWIGILLIYAFALKLNLLPVMGYTSPFDDFWLNLKQIIMPVFCLSIFGIASLTRQTRSSVLEVVHQDYIRTAWAKGLTERIIVMRHTIKNAFIPIVTTMGMHVSLVFGTSVLIETVFNIPGMGKLMRDAVFAHDYQVVQGGVLVIAMIVVITNIIVDISYGWFDPRIRYQ
jgi:peptide/nickel transport system permease protein